MAEPNSVPTVGILCALSVELSAVLSTFDTEPEKQFDAEGTTFHLGIVAGQPTVVTCLDDQGTGLANAIRRASALLNKYPSLKNKSNLRFMVGIAGGIPSEDTDVRLGDVVIATTVLNYGSGKKVPGGFQPKNVVYEAPHILLNGIQSFKVLSEQHTAMLQQVINNIISNHRARYANPMDHADSWPCPKGRKLQDNLFKADYLHTNNSSKNCSDCDSQMVEYKRKRSLDEPLIHFGWIASSDHLLKDPNMRQKLKQDHPDALAVDMESSALCQDDFIVVRGISDYADTHKNDDWQPKAAVAAAACSVLLIEHLPRFSQSETGSPLMRQDTLASIPESVREERSIATSPTSNTLPPIKPSQTKNRNTISASGRYAWSHDYKFASLRLDVLEIPDHGGRWYNGMFTLREIQASVIHETYREIVIKGSGGNNKITEIWLPLENVHVRQSGTEVAIRYSNCHVRYQDSHDWKEQNRPVYDPLRPNVTLNIRLQDALAAAQISDQLLYRCVTVPNHNFHTDLRHSDCKLYKPDQLLHHEESQILILHSVPREDEFEEVAFAHLNDCLEMTFDIGPRETTITFNDTSKIIHHTLNAKSASWPPGAVILNPSGEPQSYGFTGGWPSVITLNTDNFEAVRELFENITDGWEICTSPFQAQVTNQSRLFSRAEPKYLVLTIWKKHGWVRILARNVSQDREVEWSCIKIQEQRNQGEDDTASDDDDPKFTYVRQENRVNMYNIQQTRGNSLNRRTLEPVQSENSEREWSADTTILPLDFDTSQEMRRFLDALEEHSFIKGQPQSTHRQSGTRFSISLGRRSRSSQDSGKSRQGSTIFQQNSIAEAEGEATVSKEIQLSTVT